MPSYTAPTKDTLFVLNAIVGGDTLDPDLTQTIVDEAGRFCAEVIAPLNQPGDQVGCTRHADGSVTTPPGYREAYAQYCE
ncbi:MAG: acyl-CoA dehydrogenase, partial [Croceibacterium sp.]